MTSVPPEDKVALPDCIITSLSRALFSKSAILWIPDTLRRHGLIITDVPWILEAVDDSYSSFRFFISFFSQDVQGATYATNNINQRQRRKKVVESMGDSLFLDLRYPVALGHEEVRGDNQLEASLHFYMISCSDR